MELARHNPSQQLSWSEIASKLNELKSVEGGFTKATRGLLKIDDGEMIFVKQGVDEITCKWAKKEVGVYRFLELNNYPFIPHLLSVNPDETGFALTACLPEDGWDWKGNWTKERLDKTLEAMDMLASLKPVGNDLDFFSERNVNEGDDGWPPLLASDELQKRLIEKLVLSGNESIANSLKFEVEAKRAKDFTFRYFDIVHNDVRADNCGWNKEIQELCLVDWNWAQLGDRRIDIAATLVDVANSGFNVSAYYKKLDSGALHWLAGYWLKSAATPGPESLRDFQLKSGLIAFGLSSTIAG